MYMAIYISKKKRPKKKKTLHFGFTIYSNGEKSSNALSTRVSITKLIKGLLINSSQNTFYKEIF